MAAYLLCVLLFLVCESNAVRLDIKSSHNQTDFSSCSSSDEQCCPTWFVKRSVDGTTRCECGYTSDDVICDDDKQQVLLSVWSCMTYDDSSNDTVLGTCPFNYHDPQVRHLYITLPNDTSQLNSFMCGDLNRTGLLCSKCQKALGPAVLSYRHQCVKCLDGWNGWLMYITIALLPSTLFCLIVVIFNVRVTTAYMNAFVFLCQLISASIMISNQISFFDRTGALHVSFLAVLTFYGFWNLDFFRYFIPPFCISSDMNTLHTLALEYVVAIYPLCLVAVMYLFTQMCARGCRVVTGLWRPFHRCLGRFKGKCNPKDFVVTGFVTFLLLSYSKLLIISYSLLNFTRLYNSRGDPVSTVLTYDASIEYFSRQHLPYAILAIIVLLVLVALPLLILFLYPMKLFQRSLGHCTRIRWHPLHTFANAFQGCYKNGTNGTCDYRYFAGFYLLFRIVFLLGFVIPLDYVYLILVPLPLIGALLFAICRPYTTNIFNIIDCSAFSILSLTNFWIIYIRIHSIPIEVAYITAAIPLFYFIFFILYKILTQVKLFRTRCARIKEMLHMENNKHMHTQEADSIDDLPDRIVNPDMYRPLLSSTSHPTGREGVTTPHAQVGVNSLIAYGSM